MQTDRQTDKATCWSVTAYNGDIDVLVNKVNVPDYVKQIYGGKEECPTTGKLHFQGALLLRNQQRMSALKKWLPQSHFEIARSRDALKKYVMKEETAAGEKTEWSNPQQYEQLHEWLLKAGKEFVASEEEYYAGLKDKSMQSKDPARDSYIWSTSRLIAQDISMLNKFSNPQFIAAWRMYSPVIIAKARMLLRQEESEGHSITPSANGIDEISNDIIQEDADETKELEAQEQAPFCS